MVDKSDNQANFQNNQTFTIDIDKIYTDWIVPIDAIRSYTKINPGQTLGEITRKIGSKVDVTGISKLVKIENTVQESRCHAFFRMIGFPVTNTDNKIYNPGFDIVKCKEKKRTITLENKQSIGIAPIKDFDKLSDAREKFAQDNLAIFSNPQSIDAGVLALSSGATQRLRKFVAPLEKSTEPFDMVLNHQSYDVDLTSLVGDRQVLLTKFQGSGGETPTKITATSYATGTSNLITTRKRIIKPFIVDARIDFTVSPQSRLIAVPFVPEDAHTKVSATESVTRPLLEKIIRDRLSNKNKLSLGTNATSFLGVVSSAVNTVVGANLLKAVNDPLTVYKKDAQSFFTDFINTAKTLMNKLVNSQDIIKAAQSHYYWVPKSNSKGPEFGVSVQGVFIQESINSILKTPLDDEIRAASIQSSFGSLKTATANIDGTPATTLNFSVETTTFSPDTSDGMGDTNEQNLETIAQQRTIELTKAGEALKTIEIIMGEFSGLGLSDIVVIIGALNLLPEPDLLGFLDDDAYNRMLNALPETKGVARKTYADAMGAFTIKVKELYELMDDIYEDIRNHNGNS